MNIRTFGSKIKTIVKRLFRFHSDRNKIKVYQRGGGNTIEIDKSTSILKQLHIYLYGNNNHVVVGRKCKFYENNCFFITGDNNTLTIGDEVSFDGFVDIIQSEGTNVMIGDDCMFARNVVIRTSDQHAIYNENNTRINPAKDVIIESHVWLGNHAVVMKGATIGSGSIIGMRSMVTKNIPKNSMAVGQPAKVIKSNIHWTRTL